MLWEWALDHLNNLVKARETIKLNIDNVLKLLKMQNFIAPLCLTFLCGDLFINGHFCLMLTSWP